MTKRGAITESLYNSNWFNKCIEKLAPIGFEEDFKMEIICRVIEIEEEKLINLHESNELKFYVLRMVVNETKNKRSKFNKLYKPHKETVVDHALFMRINDGLPTGGEWAKKIAEKSCNINMVVDTVNTDREIKEAREDYALQQINGLDRFEAEMIRLYIKLGNYRDIEVQTGISFSSCYRTIKKAVAQLRLIALKNIPSV